MHPLAKYVLGSVQLPVPWFGGMFFLPLSVWIKGRKKKFLLLLLSTTYFSSLAILLVIDRRVGIEHKLLPCWHGIIWIEFTCQSPHPAIWTAWGGVYSVGPGIRLGLRDLARPLPLSQLGTRAVLRFRHTRFSCFAFSCLWIFLFGWRYNIDNECLLYDSVLFKMPLQATYSSLCFSSFLQDV